MLDARGIISAKHFEQSYRVRPTALVFEEYALGASDAGPPAEVLHAGDPTLQVAAWTDVPTYRPYQQVRLHCELSVPSELHIFGSPVPDGYTPLSLRVEPQEGLEVGRLS